MTDWALQDAKNRDGSLCNGMYRCRGSWGWERIS